MKQKSKVSYFDDSCLPHEQIPRLFSVVFKEVGKGGMGEVLVEFNGESQLGDTINDNSYENDFYRYHDIFHYSFATMLGWSPCTRAMMKVKRKSDTMIDAIEDGARATITEEALSMIIFNEAKRKNFFADTNKVSRTTLRFIKEMTENFEVKVCSSKEWELAILKAYEIFRMLISNNGGKVVFDMLNKDIKYYAVN